MLVSEELASYPLNRIAPNNLDHIAKNITRWIRQKNIIQLGQRVCQIIVAKKYYRLSPRIQPPALFIRLKLRRASAAKRAHNVPS